MDSASQPASASTAVPDPRLTGLKFDANGLIPAIIQDWKTCQVLMMAWMNRDSLERTLQTGKTHFFSRSRNKLWLKGESSGHVQHVKSVAIDCDQDVLLIKVEQIGAACHEGYASCFFRELESVAPPAQDQRQDAAATLTSPGQPSSAGSGQASGWKVVGSRVFDPKKVYSK